MITYTTIYYPNLIFERFCLIYATERSNIVDVVAIIYLFSLFYFGVVVVVVLEKTKNKRTKEVSIVIIIAKTNGIDVM